MYYIDPITITADKLLSGTSLAEDPSAAWVSGTYAVGDERHVVATHRVYRCTTAGSSTTSPELDATRWKDMRPTNLWAPFDYYRSTAATSTAANITYVLAGRFVNSMRLDGLVGKRVVVTVKDAPGGTVLLTKTISLKYPAKGYWSYAYGNRKSRKAVVLTGLPIRSNAAITITVEADGSNTRAIGLIAMGKLDSLSDLGFGGVQQDAEADPKTYTYRKTYDDGTFELLVRGSAKNASATLLMKRTSADQCVQSLEGLLGRPVAWMASLNPGFDGLSVFGIATRAPVRYQSVLASCDITIEGSI